MFFLGVLKEVSLRALSATTMSIPSRSDIGASASRREREHPGFHPAIILLDEQRQLTRNGPDRKVVAQL